MGNVENQGGVVVLTLPAEGQALPGADALIEVDGGLAAGGSGVVIDTTPREIVTSAAIGFVIMVRQHLPPEIRLSLYGGSQLRKLVEMMNLTGVLPVFDTLDAAKANVGS